MASQSYTAEMAKRSPAERAADHYHIAPNGCWEWEGSKWKGYGRINVDGRPRGAHRVLYEAIVGPIPPGLTLDHLCRNRSCVNPDHLEPVSMRVNTLRGIGPAAIHAAQTECIHGHPFDEANTYRKRNGSRDCRTCNRLRVAALRNG
jgi:hypothetical protein